ncbi:hypothetical protein V1291_005027 [Nitrobacteraceae bacterium AZCC 1564]
MKKSETSVTQAFTQIPDLLACDEALMQRGRFLDVDCLLGSTEQAYHVSIRAGRIIDMARAPILMRSWRFAYRATPQAWTAYWEPMPKAGWHDLLSLTKRGEATLEGDIYPFMTHLQYFKNLLALPRSSGGAA